VEHDQVPFSGVNSLVGFGPGLLDHANVFRIGLFGSDFHEAASHLFHNELVAEGLYRVELSVVPRALEELKHQDAHALPDGAQGGSHGGCGFTLARPRIDNDETATNVGHAVSRLLILLDSKVSCGLEPS